MARVEKGRHEWNWEISRKEKHKTLVHGCDERRKGMLRKTLRSWLVPFTQAGILNSLMLIQLLEVGTNMNEKIEAQRGSEIMMG